MQQQRKVTLVSKLLRGLGLKYSIFADIWNIWTSTLSFSGPLDSKHFLFSPLAHYQHADHAFAFLVYILQSMWHHVIMNIFWNCIICREFVTYVAWWKKKKPQNNTNKHSLNTAYIPLSFDLSRNNSRKVNIKSTKRTQKNII